MTVNVKTVYSAKSMRKPNISGYKNRREASSTIRTTLKWGIDIISCEIISKEDAQTLLNAKKAKAS